MAEGIRFRTATIGGFHKGDVLEYIRMMTEQHQRETMEMKSLLEATQQQLKEAELAQELPTASAELQETIDQLTVEKESLEQKNEELEATQSALQEELETVRQQLEAETQKSAEADALRMQLEAIAAEKTEAESRVLAVEQEQAETTSLREQIAALQQEKEALDAKVAAWEPNVNSYGMLRDQVGEIELDARTRCAELIRGAQKQEQALYLQAESTLRHAEQQFGQTKVNAEATLAYLVTELDRIRGEVEGLNDVLNRDHSALSALHVKKVQQEE